VIRQMLSRWVGSVALTVPLLALAGVSPASADAQNASITITDKGFDPVNVTIGPGGTVTFTNSGTIVHTASSLGGAPLAFNTGGLAPSQSKSISFSVPGTYSFNSETDCMNGHNSAQFGCGGGTITVSSTSPAPAPSAAPASAPVPSSPVAAPSPATTVGGSAPPAATVTISDTGMTPASVSVAQGGTVTWVNNGKQVHTATTTGGGNPLPFDTGGLGPGQSGSLVFNAAGTYTYTSTVDCVNKRPSSFGCGPFTVMVGNGTVAPGTPSPSAAAVGNTTVTIDDKNGFSPNTLTISVGQTVTWTNNGNNVHTTTSNPGYVGAWDSGGLNKGQSFTKTFTQAGTYGYHSQTEPVYTTDSSSGNVIVSYTFNGTIVVQ